MIIWRVNRELRAYNVLRFKCYSIKNYCLAKVSFLPDKTNSTDKQTKIEVNHVLERKKKHVLSLHREFDKCQYFVRKIINTRLLCERKGNKLVNFNITYPCHALQELDIHNRMIKQYQLSKTFMVSITKEIKLK